MKVFDPVTVRMAKRPTGGTIQKLKRRDARREYITLSDEWDLCLWLQFGDDDGNTKE